jgi:hypothetical protein
MGRTTRLAVHLPFSTNNRFFSQKHVRLFDTLYQTINLSSTGEKVNAKTCKRQALIFSKAIVHSNIKERLVLLTSMLSLRALVLLTTLVSLRTL